VLTASSATEYSFEGDQVIGFEAQPSVFSSALVAGLRTGAADLDGDGDISVDELYEYAYREVRRANAAQEPRKWTFGMAGSFVIARSVAAARLPDAVQADLTSDRVVLRLEAITELARLRAGTKPGLRVAATAELLRLKEHDDSGRVRMAAAAALGQTEPAAQQQMRAPEPAPTPEPVAPQPAPTPDTAPPPRAPVAERAKRAAASETTATSAAVSPVPTAASRPTESLQPW
jgi:hypothetical protein